MVLGDARRLCDIFQVLARVFPNLGANLLWIRGETYLSPIIRMGLYDVPRHLELLGRSPGALVEEGRALTTARDLRPCFQAL